MSYIDFWSRRENIKNRPSLSLRSIFVIEYVMNKYNIAMGVAIEKLMNEDGLWKSTIKEISESGYSDIEC